jgi:Skp family chaperone for outer membrane proteins
MRVFAVVPALSIVLAATVSYAQAPAQGAKPPAGQTAPAPRPQTQTPPAPQQPAPAPAPAPVPFQDGFKYAYIRVQQIASESADGKKATAEINALRGKLQKELDEKNKALQDTQKKLETGGSVLSDAARAQLQTEADRQQRDLQRMAEDAEQDVERLTQRLQQDFMVKLNPVIDRVAKEKQVHLIFNATESGLVWAAAGMDLTSDVIKALDGGSAKPAASAPAPAQPTAPPAGAPAAATPAATPPPTGAPR